MSRGGNAWEGNQALRHLHPNFLHTSPAPRPLGRRVRRQAVHFRARSRRKRRWGRERGCRTTARNPPGCTGAVLPPAGHAPQAPRRSVARGEDQAGAALRPGGAAPPGLRCAPGPAPQVPTARPLNGGLFRQVIPGRRPIQGIHPLPPRRTPAPRRTSPRTEPPERPPPVPAPHPPAGTGGPGLSVVEEIVPPSTVIQGHRLPGVHPLEEGGHRPPRRDAPAAHPGDTPPAAASRTGRLGSRSGGSSPPGPPDPGRSSPGFLWSGRR